MLCATTLAAIAVLHRALQPGRDEETEQEHQTWPTPVPHSGPLGINSRHRISSHDDTEAAAGALNGIPGLCLSMVWAAAGWTSKLATARLTSTATAGKLSEAEDHTVGLFNAPPAVRFL